MDHLTRESLTTSEGGIEVQKSLDTRQFQHPVVLFTLRSNRDEPVEVRVTDPLPASVETDAIEVYRNSSNGVWHPEPGTMTFTGALAPGEERTSLYLVADEAIADQLLTEPELDIQPVRWKPTRHLKHLKTVAIYVVAGLVLFYKMTFLLPTLLTASPVFLVVVLLLLLVTAAGMWKTFVKVGQPGWKAIIPVYNVFILLRITGHPWWWVLGLFLPLLSGILWVKVSVDLSRTFGRGLRFGVGLALLSFVFWPLLGFGEYDYQGGGPRTDPDRIIQAVEWMGNLENYDVAEATVETLRSASPDALTAYKLRYAIEAVEAYQDHGAVEVDLDEARQSLISTWEVKTGANWETTRAA